MSLLRNIRKKKVGVYITPPSKPDNYLDNEIYRMIYSDPNGSLSDSSLGLVMSGEVRPEVQQFVQSNLPFVPNTNTFENADDALDFTPDLDLQFGREREVVGNKFLDYIKKFKDVE